MPPDPVSFTVQHLSALTGVPERTLHHNISKGALRAHRVGRRRLYITREDAESFLGYPISRNADAKPLHTAA